MALLVGFYPFWFWNDRLSGDEIRWQVHEMAARGARFLHPLPTGPRTTLLIQRSSRWSAWLSRRRGTKDSSFHLYDEYPYPSQGSPAARSFWGTRSSGPPGLSSDPEDCRAGRASPTCHGAMSFRV